MHQITTTSKNNFPITVETIFSTFYKRNKDNSKKVQLSVIKLTKAAHWEILIYLKSEIQYIKWDCQKITVSHWLLTYSVNVTFPNENLIAV